MRIPKEDDAWREFISTDGGRRARRELAEDVRQAEVALLGKCRKSNDPDVRAAVTLLDELRKSLTYMGGPVVHNSESG